MLTLVQMSSEGKRVSCTLTELSDSNWAEKTENLTKAKTNNQITQEELRTSGSYLSQKHRWCLHWSDGSADYMITGSWLTEYVYRLSIAQQTQTKCFPICWNWVFVPCRLKNSWGGRHPSCSLLLGSAAKTLLVIKGLMIVLQNKHFSRGFSIWEHGALHFIS